MIFTFYYIFLLLFLFVRTCLHYGSFKIKRHKRFVEKKYNCIQEPNQPNENKEGKEINIINKRKTITDSEPSKNKRIYSLI